MIDQDTINLFTLPQLVSELSLLFFVHPEECCLLVRHLRHRQPGHAQPHIKVHDHVELCVPSTGLPDQLAAKECPWLPQNVWIANQRLVSYRLAADIRFGAALDRKSTR